ncbi:MAG TPA: DUF6069 family protein [Acidimicrobiales bacterium]|nr:DUF6069 family protein [Acidimicrobiales bacterium]
MTTTLNPTFADAPSRPDLAKAPVAVVGAVAGAVAAIAATAVAVAAKAVDVPMLAAPKTDPVGRAIPMYGFAMGTLLSTTIGIVIAVALLRYAKRPARTFAIVTTVLTVASFSGPITTGHATTATRLVLSLTHVVAAAIVIPAVTWRLAQRATR